MDDTAHDDDGSSGEVSVTTCPDGPLLLRGPFTLLDGDGEAIPKGRRTVALCRCGGSAIRPFCDGTHKEIGFTAPGGAEGERPAPPAPEQAGRVGGDGEPRARVGHPGPRQPGGERGPGEDGPFEDPERGGQ
ncbi:hypothetical protein CQJ94_09830 [Glycomyces fuscus]|nr:hypothetical protein CQJ94_09830 [Glycomyces fuscus]